MLAVLALTMPQQLSPTARACGCGWLGASVQCPGCTPHAGTYGCSCDFSQSRCEGTFGSYPVYPAVQCRLGRWPQTVTVDPDGLPYCAVLRDCEVGYFCEPDSIANPCGIGNPCVLEPDAFQDWDHSYMEGSCLET